MNNRRFVESLTESAAKYPHDTFSKKGAVYTCVNPYSYHLVRQRPDLFDGMDGLFADGMLMCVMVKLLWNTKIPRLSFDMAGMAVDLFKRLDRSGESIFFLGAKQEEIEASMDQIRSTYPGMNIAGFRNGYFKDTAERDVVIASIVEENPDFVVIGMGAPLQEQFVLDLKKAGYRGIAFTCGGFLHQTKDGINYYPEWVNKYNLRAFYRLFHEKGMFKRLYNVLIQFPVLFTTDSLRSRGRRVATL